MRRAHAELNALRDAYSTQLASVSDALRALQVRPCRAYVFAGAHTGVPRVPGLRVSVLPDPGSWAERLRVSLEADTDPRAAFFYFAEARLRADSVALCLGTLAACPLGALVVRGACTNATRSPRARFADPLEAACGFRGGLGSMALPIRVRASFPALDGAEMFI